MLDELLAWVAAVMVQLPGWIFEPWRVAAQVAQEGAWWLVVGRRLAVP